MSKHTHGGIGAQDYDPLLDITTCSCGTLIANMAFVMGPDWWLCLGASRCYFPDRPLTPAEDWKP